MEFIKVKLSDIKPYENNPRRNDQAVEAVAESIRQCGYIAPIIVDEDNVILAGHTRYKALKKLGRKEAECVVKAGLTEEQKRKYRLLDNKTNEFAEWDFDLLADELEGLDFGDFDFGFDIGDDEEPPKVTEDEYDAEPPAEPKAKLGDIYQLGRHRLMCGDSTRFADVEKLVDGQKVDLFLTDPPYNIAYTGKTKDALTIQNDSMPEEEFRNFLKKSLENAKAVMKPGASFYIWHADNEGYTFRGAVCDAGLSLRQNLIWAKNRFTLGRQDYQWQHEPCLYGWADGASHNWYSDRKQSTILNYDSPTASKEHPTMKPIALFDYQIRNSTKSGDIVLDLFGGSGTTIMAAEQDGRTGYLMELDPRYVDVIIDRWEKFTGQTAKLISEPR